jgi:hypothetical protein
MKKFGIFYRSDPDAFRAVKHGFSFPGFFLQWIWLVYKRMYVRGTLFFFAYILLGNLIYGMEKDASPLMYGLRVLIPILEHPPLIENEALRVSAGVFRTLAFGLIIGAFGNEWYRRSLIKRGFLHVTDVEAAGAKLALDHVRSAHTS